LYEEIKSLYSKNIGRLAYKNDSSLFSNGSKYSTIKDIVRHPEKKDRYAFSFEEVEDIIEISECKLK